jgi:hypothetical protein
MFLGALAPGFVFLPRERPPRFQSGRAEAGVAGQKTGAPMHDEQVHGSFCGAGFDNDPSAGSPTETLLRLLLPLNDKVQ